MNAHRVGISGDGEDPHHLPFRCAGGDCYDIAELSNGRLAILLADAEGHSAPAGS